MGSIMHASQGQVVQLRELAAGFERKAAQVSSVVAARWAWYDSLRTTAEGYGYGPSTLFGAELAQLNEKADVAAVKWASIVAGLNARKLELAGWVRPESPNITLGVVTSGSVHAGLNAWPLAAVLVVAVGGALAVGAWTLVDAYLEARNVEAQAAHVHAQNQRAATAAVTAAAQQSPQAAQLVASALAKANQAAAQPANGILDKLATLAGRASDAVGGVGKDTLIMGLLLWLAWHWSKKK